jgi:hypothetical protein
MKILSIDVGMKNLAYCYIEKNDTLHDTSNNSYSILDWNVVDLTDSDKYVCKCLKKNNKVCGKKATFFKNATYYCKTHAKQSEYNIPADELNIRKIDKKLVSELKHLVKKYNIPLPLDETDDKGKPIKITKTVLLNCIKKELLNNYLMPIVIKKTSSISLVDYGISLKDKFSNIFKYDEIDCVIIENQIGPLALRMKMLQGMITQHFIENNIKNIEMINSSNKLNQIFGSGKKMCYKERKLASIKYTLSDLTENAMISKWCDHFNKHRKKDDLADCYLQCKWYMRNSNNK